MILKDKSLKSLFLNEHFADDRFQDLNEKFSTPLLEPVMLFHSSVISLFTHFNLILQREEPTIHILKSAMGNLGKRWLSKLWSQKKSDISSISDINLESPDIFKDTKMVTKSTLKKHLNKGDITVQWHKDFYDAA